MIASGRQGGTFAVEREGRIGYNVERRQEERMKARLRRWANRIERWEFFIFIRAIEPLAILIAFIAFFNELNYRHWALLYTILAEEGE